MHNHTDPSTPDPSPSSTPARDTACDGTSTSPWRRVLWVVAGIFLLLWLWQTIAGPGQRQPIPYSQFKTHLADGHVTEVILEGHRLEGTLEESVTRSVDGQEQTYRAFRTHVPAFGDDALLTELSDAQVAIITQPDADGGWWSALLFVGGPLLLFTALGFWFVRSLRARMAGRGLTGISKSKAKRYIERDTATTFDDVAGAAAVKEELQEIVSFLAHPERFERLGARIPKGVLLVGPPGTGKTLLARAVAGEAGVPFYSITGSDFMEMFVGVGASRVRDMFKEAREQAPCIIFIDEIDSIGRRRGAGLGGGHDEREQTLNQLLSELDGFEQDQHVVVMAATNRPDILDPALLRPGRFDRRVNVDVPIFQDRKAILELHAANKPFADDVDLEALAHNTPGMSGADLRNLLNEAALVASREHASAITMAHLDEAFDRIAMGLERRGLMLHDDDRELLAYHEAGHAVVTATLEHADAVRKVTIIPRGRAMGVTQQQPSRERYVTRREALLDRIAVLMGGRAAEDVVLNAATTGAADDFKRATALAKKMVLAFGMSDDLGPVSFDDDNDNVFLGESLTTQQSYSDATARELDVAVRDILNTCYDRARGALVQHRAALDAIASALLERDVVSGDEVVRLIADHTPHALTAAA